MMSENMLDGGRAMLEKIKDQAADTGKLVTVLIDARKVIASVECSCASVNSYPCCERCRILSRIDDLV